MKDVFAAVTYKEKIGEKYFRLGLKVGWDEFVPGQFVMLQVPGNEVFVRRPFGIVRVEDSILEICFKVVGKGTVALSRVNPNESLFVFGPLGRGFTPQKDINEAILVAGGYGIAPLFSLAWSLTQDGKKVVLYYGVKKRSDLLYCNQLRASGVDLRIATEDGCEGYKGLVTDLLEKEVAQKQNGSIFSAGPSGLLCEVAKIAAAFNITAQVSLERYMACGIGVCLGCMVRLRDGSYARACRDGPVFDAEKIAWE